MLINLQSAKNCYGGCLCPFVPATILSASPGRVWVVGAAMLAQLYLILFTLLIAECFIIRCRILAARGAAGEGAACI